MRLATEVGGDLLVASERVTGLEVVALQDMLPTGGLPGCCDLNAMKRQQAASAPAGTASRFPKRMVWTGRMEKARVITTGCASLLEQLPAAARATSISPEDKATWQLSTCLIGE